MENGRDAPVGGVVDESWGEEERKIGRSGRKEEEEKDCWWWWWLIVESGRGRKSGFFPRGDD
jgi:hypothetical protein